MQYRTLGRTGLRVSEIGVGGAQFGLTNYMGTWDAFSAEAQRMTTATIHRALELGYNYFDTAPGYGDGRSEEMVGAALKGHRDEVVIASADPERDGGARDALTGVRANDLPDEDRPVRRLSFGRDLLRGGGLRLDGQSGSRGVPGWCGRRVGAARRAPRHEHRPERGQERRDRQPPRVSRPHGSLCNS